MTKNEGFLFLFLTMFWLMSPLRAQGPEGNARIRIDPSQKYQQIQGFGVNYTGPFFRDDQKAMFDMLIDDLGATIDPPEFLYQPK